MANVNLLAILIAAASGFLVGGIWYGPLFGKAWQAEIGLSDDQLKNSNMLKIYGTTFLFSLLSAVFLGHLLAHFPDADFRRVMMISTGIALAFVGPAIGTNYLFGRKSGKLFAIDAGYWLVFYAAMGLVFALLGA
ncbi:DUF1761 domain-containing protein [Sphingorhabdus sp.]|jgi:hypothetical protein|uniref:DUF1761 domain-containing protein n=1 Tax=Sphingorhabdus sp. TaxID=1902408 RepID=UPI003BB1EAF7|nr:DUF1761 domain-containing protein [Sphingomonadales bacterium]MBK9430885.1 DUF1761 domain-containing protein [Sphingomonadales bacterium]MBL0021032.1 DUF1761 domain-containing protein [Sphingomonadales bacterium]